MRSPEKPHESADHAVPLPKEAPPTGSAAAFAGLVPIGLKIDERRAKLAATTCAGTLGALSPRPGDQMLLLLTDSRRISDQPFSALSQRFLSVVTAKRARPFGKLLLVRSTAESTGRADQGRSCN